MRRAAGEAREGGSVTMLALALLIAAVVLAAGGARLGAALVLRARAETAADAAALAAADALALGRGAAASSEAARVAADDNGAVLLECRCRGEVAQVLVRTVAGVFGRTARARARAEVDQRCVVLPLRCARP